MEMHEKNETPWLKSLITGEPGDKQQSTDTTAEQSPESTGEPGDRRTWRQDKIHMALQRPQANRRPKHIQI